MEAKSPESLPSTRTGEQALRPRARLLRTLGDELISSERVALIELIKNAYDADATRVLVRFQGPLDEGKGRIEVLDNGHGMSLETVRTAWMEPATLFRKLEHRSAERNRRVLGEKGIGRFAAARLGNVLELVTRRSGERYETRAIFDWSQFDNPDRFLDEIEVLWEEVPPVEIVDGGTVEALYAWDDRGPNGRDHGTVLRMEPLRARWTEEGLAELRRSMSRLVSPSFSEVVRGKDEFSIYLDLPEEFEELSGRIEPPAGLGRPRYTLRGNVRADGSYNLRLQVRDRQEQQVTGLIEFKGSRAPECGPFNIELLVWDRDPAGLRELVELYGSTITNIRKDLDSSAGINIYRDGFRVLPYGEPQQDWLRLDLRRVQNPTQRLSNNQVIGYVSISSDKNPNLRDQTNREGLMEGPALDDLREAIKAVLHQLEIRRYKDRRAERPESRRGLFQDFNLASLRTAIQERHGEDLDLLAAVDAKEIDLEQRVAEVQEVLARYRRLATLGQLVDRILHDGRTPLAKIGNEATLGLLDIEGSQQPDHELLSKLVGRLQTINRQKASLDSLLERIEPFGGRSRGRPRIVRLEQIIADAFAVLDAEIREVGATAELPATTTQVTVEPSELEQVIVNLLQNSLYWLRQVPKQGRAIVVKVIQAGEDAVEIVFSDSGPGVEEEFRDQIFEPYFSTKPNGIGLGLTIAGEIISDYYDGKVELMDTGPLPGATFRLVLRRRV
jgi:signal transduction histidine kinase